MGNFIISVIIIVLIIGFTITNSIIICNTCDDILSLLDKNDLEGACALWEQKCKYISFFVRDAEIDVVTAEVKNIQSHIPFEDGQAQPEIMPLAEAIYEIKNSEKIDFPNLF